MSLRRGSGRARAPLVLALLCAVLGGAIYLELQPPPIEAVAAPRPSLRNPVKPPARTATFSMPPMASYGEVVQRPLFSETRRPAPKAGPAAEPNSAGFALNGTVMTDGGRDAIIQHGQPPRQERFSTGQQVEGWTIESIDRDLVVLVHGGRHIELKTDLKGKDGLPQVRAIIPLRGAGQQPLQGLPSTLNVQPVPLQTQPQQDAAQPIDNNLASRMFGRLPGHRPEE